MAFNPVNYGNILAQTEQIQGGRINNALNAQRLDPNSIQNQLAQAKIAELQRTAAGGGGPGMAPISFKDATGDSIAEFQRTGDPSVLKRHYTPYKPWTVDTKTDREFWDIDVNTREPVLIKSVPINNFDASRDAELGKSSAELGGIPSSSIGITGGQPNNVGLGGGNVQPSAAPSKASLAGDVTREQETAKIDVERTSPTEVKKQSMREADAVNAVTIIDDMLAPRSDGGGIYATYAYGKGNVILPDLAKKPEWIDAEAKRNQLVSMMQLENVAKLKGTGPITEPEQKVLRQAMTVLENPLISAKLVERELKRVRVMFARWEREAKTAQGKGGAAAVQGGGSNANVVDWNKL